MEKLAREEACLATRRDERARAERKAEWKRIHKAQRRHYRERGRADAARASYTALVTITGSDHWKVSCSGESPFSPSSTSDTMPKPCAGLPGVKARRGLRLDDPVAAGDARPWATVVPVGVRAALDQHDVD